MTYDVTVFSNRLFLRSFNFFSTVAAAPRFSNSLIENACFRRVKSSSDVPSNLKASLEYNKRLL